MARTALSLCVMLIGLGSLVVGSPSASAGDDDVPVVGQVTVVASANNLNNIFPAPATGNTYGTPGTLTVTWQDAPNINAATMCYMVRIWRTFDRDSVRGGYNLAANPTCTILPRAGNPLYRFQANTNVINGVGYTADVKVCERTIRRVALAVGTVCPSAIGDFVGRPSAPSPSTPGLPNTGAVPVAAPTGLPGLPRCVRISQNAIARYVYIEFRDLPAGVANWQSSGGLEGYVWTLTGVATNAFVIAHRGFTWGYFIVPLNATVTFTVAADVEIPAGQLIGASRTINVC
jgi:hypothetical protein